MPSGLLGLRFLEPKQSDNWPPEDHKLDAELRASHRANTNRPMKDNRMSEYTDLVLKNAISVLTVAIEGEPDLDPDALLAWYEVVREQVEAPATPTMKLAVGLFCASPGPKGFDARMSRFTEIVEVINQKERSFWEDHEPTVI